MEKLRLEIIPPKENWRNQANCLGVDPNIFYPESGESHKEAEAICQRCVVQPDCLSYAIEKREKFGIWGGTSERERRRIQRKFIS